MITKLTKEQEIALKEYRDKWLDIGLSTEECDKEQASKDIDRVYQVAGLSPPKIKIWLRSPFEGAIASWLLLNLAQVRDQVRDQVGGQVGDQVRNQVWDQVGDQVGAQVWDQVGGQVGGQVGDQVWNQVLIQVRDQVLIQVRDQVGNQVRAQVWDQVWNQVGAQVWDQVRAQVGAQVWDQVRAQVGDQVWNQVWDQVFKCGYGSSDSNWLGLYDYFRQFKLAEKLSPLIDFSKNCGWWWPFKNVVIMTEKPIVINRDLQNRLHCESGAALVYRDGFSIYALHGVRVDKKYIEKPKNELDPKEVIAEKNAEIRMAVMKYIGIEKFIQQLDHKVLDKKKDYELLGVRLNEGGRYCEFLKMVNPSTKEIHIEGVKPNIKTVNEALAWRAGLTVFTNPNFTS